MATVLSGWFDSRFKSYFSYSTETTNTAYKITVTAAGVWQDCTWSEYNWKTVLSVTNYDSRTGSVGVTYWNSGYHALISADKTYSFTRKTSAYTVTIKAKSTQVATGKNATASKTFTVPALPSYKVTYNANGGSGAPSAQTKYYGKTLTLSSTKPTRSGYTFVGWGTSATDTTVDYSAGEVLPTSVNKALTLYAIWKKTITLTYNANGGSGAPSEQSATVYNATTSNTFTLSSTKPTRTGYTFLGWGTSASATSATYSAGNSVTLSANTTLYAVWKINSYKLTVNPNGGSWNGSTGNQSFTQNYQSTKSIPLPTWTGHTFNGWLHSGGGSLSGTTYTYGTSDGTLTARWDTNDYLVTFDARTNGGRCYSEDSNVGSATEPYEYGEQLGELPTAGKRNYTFLGWFTAPTGGTKITTSYKVTKNVTLYAQFEIDATAYANDEKVWKEGVVYTNVNGTMKKGHAMVNVDGIWEDGICK